MEDVIIAKVTGDLVVRVKNGTKEAAVGTGEFFVEIAKKAKRQDRLILFSQQPVLLPRCLYTNKDVRRNRLFASTRCRLR